MDCLLGLGSNVGDRAAVLDSAVARLDALPTISVSAVSRWHETAPIGGPSGQGAFLNGAARLQTSLSPHLLWQTLQEVETSLGRRRHVRWAQRTLDLDLLLYGSLAFSSKQLTVPHVRMAARRFVLEPALDVAADLLHPRWGVPLKQLDKRLDDGHRLLAVCSVDAELSRSAATAIADQFGAGILLGDAELPRLEHGSGRALDEAIEFLRNVASQFKQTATRDGPWTVTDGSLAWLIHELTGRLPPSRRPMFRNYCRRCFGGSVTPCFTLLIDPELETEQMAHPPLWLGPALVVSGRDRDRVIEEGAALLAAME